MSPHPAIPALPEDTSNMQTSVEHQTHAAVQRITVRRLNQRQLEYVPVSFIFCNKQSTEGWGSTFLLLTYFIVAMFVLSVRSLTKLLELKT